MDPTEDEPDTGRERFASLKIMRSELKSGPAGCDGDDKNDTELDAWP